MKRLISAFWVHSAAALLISVAIALGGLPGKATTSEAETPQTDGIANKILEYQQSGQKWIQVDLSNQRLVAWEGTNPVYAIIISTGKTATPTIIGTFAIQTKYRYARMTGADYDVPNVPYTMYFYKGYAIHGAFWHNRFGTPVSHGCVNVAPNHAAWLFQWADVGTPVVVHQ